MESSDSRVLYKVEGVFSTKWTYYAPLLSFLTLSLNRLVPIRKLVQRDVSWNHYPQSKTLIETRWFTAKCDHYVIRDYIYLAA